MINIRLRCRPVSAPFMLISRWPLVVKAQEPARWKYLFASLAGCIATTGRIIATQQNLDLKGMDIKVEGPLDLNIIYGKSKDGRPGVKGINVGVALDSAMSEMERQGFFEELRSRCPISDTIAAATPITITAV